MTSPWCSRPWQPRTDRPHADEDATEMISNMVGFIRILDEWSAAGPAKRCLRRSGHEERRVSGRDKPTPVHSGRARRTA